MNRLLALAVLLSAGAIFRVGSAAEDAPHWIWAQNGTGEAQLSKSFVVAGPPHAATLQLAADFCTATVQINGRRAIVVEPYCQAVELDVAHFLLAEENEVSIVGRPVAGPAAIALTLSLETQAGRQSVRTDESWSNCESLGQVPPELWGIGRRSAAIDALDNYEQWQQAAGAAPATQPATFWSPPGFEIALLRTAAAEEGSWVSLAFDPAGRLTIAREDQGLLRLTLDEARRGVAQVETIDAELKECRGLLYAHGALYASANNSKGLYRLRDADGDGRFDETKLLRELPGGVGHGRNDLALGPDGAIYWICGDSVEVPTTDVLDRTSPLREARRGHQTSEGFLLRTDKDGQHWELLAAGLRNPFGVAVSAAGDPFTYDADAEFDMGTPWYRPTRVLQLASGADFGWRGVTGRWPPYFPDHPHRATGTLDIGKGSPTAVAFGAGSQFPPPYNAALFILDWTYGRVLAVHLAPRGAGYRAQAETFVKGRPLNVTDLAFGPDGAMYLITGGRKTQSALYRIVYSGPAVAPAVVGRHERDCAEHALLARKTERSLAAFHAGENPAALAAAWPHLSGADPVLRQAARVAVEHQPLTAWREKALTEEQPTAALTLLLSLLHSGDRQSLAAIRDRLLALDVGRMSASEQLMLQQAHQLLHEAEPALLASRKDDCARQIDAILAACGQDLPLTSVLGTDSQVRREAARLLVALDPPGSVERVTKLLLAGDLQEERLMGLLLLRGVKQGWTPATRRSYYLALADGERFIGGEGMPQFLASLREESLATLNETERNELADLLAPAATEPDLVPPARAIVKQWSLEHAAELLEDGVRGDATRGAGVFQEALCVRCHRVGARGPAVGPDLTHVAGRFSRRDLLQSIFAPDAVVAENYRNVQVLLHDGRSLVGRVQNEGDYRGQKIRLATNPLRPSETMELDKREVERSQPSSTSPMPAGLLDTFDAQAIVDLLAFLESGAQLPARAVSGR